MDCVDFFWPVRLRPFENEEAAVELANASRYGLAAGGDVEE